MKFPFLYEENCPLSHYTTFAVGGPARFFSKAKSIQEIQEMMAFAHCHCLPFFILGKGSNCLFDDRGFNGLVILNQIDHATFLGEAHEVIAGGGYSFTRLGQLCSQKGWGGLEFASGIPGTVGGAIYMNAGANGQATSDTLTQVKYVTYEGELKTYSVHELKFSYRTSPFQRDRGVIVEGSFQLTPAETAKSNQKQLLSYRVQTQPYGEKSAGCIFRNPVGGSAGQLIEQCGLKGLEEGSAMVSKKHANFIVNEGGASAQEVLKLIEKVKQNVYDKTHIQLIEEVCYIPYVP